MESQVSTHTPSTPPVKAIQKRNNQSAPFDVNKVKTTLLRESRGLEGINHELILKDITRNISEGISTNDLEKLIILSTKSFIEHDPSYDLLSARILLKKIYKEAIGVSTTEKTIEELYKKAFITSINHIVSCGIGSKKLLDFDLEKLASHLKQPRDRLFRFLGIQTLYEKYLFKNQERRIELPQAFWMRVAMGLAIGEKNKNEKALEFYQVLSTLRYVPSTPTLLHAGFERAQLSSCFLSTVEDDLHHIFKVYGDSAQLSKYSGGVSNDWTNIRSVGADIKSINVPSQGLVPFLKIANDVTASINRSGKRRGASVVYLETWHLEIEDFLDLRRNTGDERRRTHDISTANWIPDLFMKRVLADQEWTLFSPHEVPELHHIYGKAFEEKYLEYEQLAKQGKLKNTKTVSAQKLWRKMIGKLFETGHPWITFKDPCNVRSPQDHAGVVHCSNLCTEITLNTSSEETAVCNLGSINLEKHITKNGKIDYDLLQNTIQHAMRMLDNVIDINFYPVKETHNANFKHRPVGLGLMGVQDALFKQDITFSSPAALTFSDNVMEFISYHAILNSSKLAQERGAYHSYKGSKWDRGIFPLDTLDLLEQERGEKVNVSRTASMDWAPVKEHVKKYGMRNSNTMAIAPTATISNIAGCYPCIEPMYKNIYVKANMSGEFTVINHYLIDDLKKEGIWSKEMLDYLKYFDGNIQAIPQIPQHLKDKYKEAFDIDPEWLVHLTAARGKWIDQSQSHNVFLQGTSGKKIHDVYIAGWKAGLKTFYYLRSLGASQIEKSTLDAKKFGFTQKRVYAEKPSCKIEDPDCESCQ